MARHVIFSDKAPSPVGAYSQGIHLETSDMVFISGQIGMNPETGEMAEGIQEQTAQVMENLKAVVEAAGGNMHRVLKSTIFLTDMNDFSSVNDIYAGYFSDEPPARSCVGVASLPKGALVEIECIARV